MDVLIRILRLLLDYLNRKRANEYEQDPGRAIAGPSGRVRESDKTIADLADAGSDPAEGRGNLPGCGEREETGPAKGATGEPLMDKEESFEKIDESNPGNRILNHASVMKRNREIIEAKRRENREKRANR